MGRTSNGTDLISVILRACVSLSKDDGKVEEFHVILNDTGLTNRTSRDSSRYGDSGAVMYIVFVLVFYSLFIVIMIIKSSKSEKREMEEEQALDNYFKGMPFGKSMQEHYMNKIAIKAFHTLTSAYNKRHEKVTRSARNSSNLKDVQEQNLLETDV